MSEKTAERVLVFGDDMRIFLAVVRSLGRAGKEVHAAPFNWHSPALKSKYVSAVHELPRYSDDPVAWRTAVTKLLQTHSFYLIVPCCDDRAILPFHMHRDQFAGYPVAIPNPVAMDLLFDKERTRALCRQLGVSTVKGDQLDPADTAKDLVARYGLPLVLKPRKSYWLDKLDSWGKVWIVESEAELETLLGTIQEPSRYLVESFFEGVGVGVSVLADEGKILHAFQHRRLREGRGGSSSHRISEAINPALYEACRKICEHTKLTGVCMFEFRYNPDNHTWILIETNARFWGSSPLPLSLGVNFPLYLYDLLVHRRAHPRVDYALGITSRNVVLDAFNLMAEFGRLRPGELGNWAADVWNFMTQPIRWLTGRERSDTFVADDLRPALWECSTLMRSMLQKRDRKRAAQLNRRSSEQAA